MFYGIEVSCDDQSMDGGWLGWFCPYVACGWFGWLFTCLLKMAICPRRLPETVQRNAAEPEIELNAMDNGKAGDPPMTESRQLRRGILVDTGAAATVADGEIEFPECELVDSPGSVAGQHFVGPGGQRIPCKGQRAVRIRLGRRDGKLARIEFQDAKVRRPRVRMQTISMSLTKRDLPCFPRARRRLRRLEP